MGDIADVLPPPEYGLVVVPDGFAMLDGVLAEKRMGEKSCWVRGELFGLIWTFLKAHPLGRLYPQDTGFRCFPEFAATYSQAGRRIHPSQPTVARSGRG